MLLMNDMHVSKNDIAEFDRNWDEALALCRERSIRDIALGGDLFQSRSAQTLDVLLAVHDALLRAAGAGIRLTIAEGNHDKVNQEDLRGYCHVFDCHPSVTVVDDILTLDDPAWAFSLHMMGYFPEGGSFTSRLAALATSGLVEGKLNYLYIHEGVNGALATAAPCELPPRIFEPFDRVFAGHYHNRAVVPGTRIEYVGSSRQFNFGEDEAKGYTILCTDGSSEFVQNEANIRYKVLDTSADKVGIHLFDRIDELRADILKAKSMIPGSHRLNLHEIYGDFGGKKVDRDEVEPAHFASWMQWARENGMKLDFNSTSFSHPKSGDLTLANPDKGIRSFWVEHTKRCRAISEEMGRYQDDPCMMNLWIHDGSKEVPANRLKYRRILEQSLDEIFEKKYGNMKDCIEAKLFGIGLESYTVGSYDFYLGYGAKKGKIVTLDTGHFHLTESIADKVSSLLLFTPEIMLHVSRPIRWDSDHVVILSDDLLDLAREIIRCDALDRVHIGLDYFDATINRIGAYVIGSRATQKAFMQALLEPRAALEKYEEQGRYFQRLALQEEAKSLPWNAVWDMYCQMKETPVGESFIGEIEKYEREVTSKR